MNQHILDYIDHIEQKVRDATGTGDINDQIRHIYRSILLAELAHYRYNVLMT